MTILTYAFLNIKQNSPGSAVVGAGVVGAEVVGPEVVFTVDAKVVDVVVVRDESSKHSKGQGSGKDNYI